MFRCYCILVKSPSGTSTSVTRPRNIQQTGRICEIEGSSGRFRSHKLRKGLKSAGAAVQGTALSTMIEANADPRKLLDRISTNQKDIVHKELAGKVAPIRPEGKEPDLSILLESSAATSDLPAPDSELTQTGLQSNNPESTQARGAISAQILRTKTESDY
ncbi:hypothetical protein H4Q26_016362 [Puccinia striiformis f. sp. tritici PST-130]|nr:hypothetical protein H4Q26_016362 [Puccinia striiformis f. sp. tritici PST-130]